jgi:hypothetical protein
MDKNDRKYGQFASVSHLINGYGEWVQSLFDNGFRMYLVTFKFNHIPASSEYKRREMLKQVEYQFYPTLIKHVERRPMKPSRQCNLPINRISRFTGSKAFKEIVSERCHDK